MQCPNCAAAAAAKLPTRRAFIAGFVCAAVTPAAAAVQADGTASAEDERFMRMALAEARRSDYPFGAVIVRNGHVIARGRNSVRSHHDPTAHAEMVAIRNCVAEQGGAALRGSTLYTTDEPCVMCMGAILWSRMGRLVFGASVAQLATKMNQIMITSAELAAKAPFVPIKIAGGVLADEAMKLFH